MGKKNDISGQRFGKLIAVKPIGLYKNKCVLWHCKCDCGNTKEATTPNLNRGSTTSCGCNKSESAKNRIAKYDIKSSKEKHEVYRIWCGIKNRCFSKSDKAYKNYGGRGISISKEWMDFNVFFFEMGFRPSKNHSIERINNNENYQKGNCKWATKTEQNQNMRSNVWFEYEGRKMVMAQWNREFNLPVGMLRHYLKKYSFEYIAQNLSRKNPNP